MPAARPDLVMVAMDEAPGTLYGERLLDRLGGQGLLVGPSPAAVGIAEPFAARGLAIAPCSLDTVAALARGVRHPAWRALAHSALEAGRRVVLLVTETPFTADRLDDFLTLTRRGAIVYPAVPAFYHHPATVDEIVGFTVMRLLDLFDVALDDEARWTGVMKSR